MDVQLVMFTETGERREFDLKRSVSIIGRAGDCDLQIPLPIVSRRHCQITRKNDRVLVKDLGSSNGSYINNKRVLQAEVHAGDILTVGPVVFTILIDGKPTDIKKIPTILKPDADTTNKTVALAEAPVGDSGIDLAGESTTSTPAADGSSIDFAALDHIEITDDAGHTTSSDSSAISPLAELEALAKQQKK